jgi:hypothetical protein
LAIEITLELPLKQRNQIKQWIDDHQDFRPEKVYYDWDSAQNVACCPRVYECSDGYYAVCYVRIPDTVLNGEPNDIE